MGKVRDAASNDAGRASQPRRAVALAVVVLGALGALTACAPAPGEARVRLSGFVAGTASGPAAQCHGPSFYADEYASWEWTGTIGGQQVRLLVADIGPIVVSFTITGSNDQFGTVQGTPGFQWQVNDDGTVHLHALLQRLPITSQNSGPTIEATMTLHCPEPATAWG